MKKTIQDVNVQGKKVFVRVDYNVPLKDGQVTDDTRISKSLPTVKYLQDKGARVILASHLGRPKGEVTEKYRMAPVKGELEELLGNEVKMGSEDWAQTIETADSLAEGEILLLENLRFHPGEEDNDSEFAAKLGAMADVYVNDAFGAAHRAHASTHGITEHISGNCVTGMLMAKELEFLGEKVADPKRPFVAVIGGAKISDKINVIRRLIDTADQVLIGGGMANTFLTAKGYQMGKSLVEQDALDTAKELLDKAANQGVELLLPGDVVVAKKLEKDVEHTTVAVSDIPESEMALDVGDKTITNYAHTIKQGETVVMNGPMGVFETPPFDIGTMEVAKAMADCPGITVVGGGDSVAAINKAGLEEQITHISTGGGASLKFLEGKALPGVEVLEDK